MAIVAPQGRKYLSADALFRLVHSGFASLPDYRVGETEIALADALMSAFAMFSLKAPSGFDHGVGHSLLVLCDAKAPHGQK